MAELILSELRKKDQQLIHFKREHLRLSNLKRQYVPEILRRSKNAKQYRFQRPNHNQPDIESGSKRKKQYF